MRYAARNADGVIRAQNEGRAPSLQFQIGEYRLDAVFAHDSIARFRDNQINATRR